MKRTRIAWSTLAALSLVVGTAACKKEKAEEGEAAETAGKTGEAPGTEPATGAAATTTGTALKYLPGDAELVASFSMDSARKSGLWKKYEAQIMEGAAEDFAEFKATCGMDPMTALSTMTVAVNSADENKSLVVVSGDVDKDTFIKCAEAMAKKEGEELTVEEDGNVVHFQSGGDGLFASWVGGNQIVIAPDEADKAWFTARAAGTEGLDKNADLMAMMNKADQSTTLWFAGVPAEGTPMRQGMSSMPSGAATGFYGSVNLTDGVALDVGMSYATAEAATQTVEQLKGMMEMAKQQMPPAAKYVDKAVVAAEASDVVVKLELTGEDLDEIGSTFGQMIPGFGAP